MKFNDMSDVDATESLGKMSLWFARFSGQCHESPMYKWLSKKISEDVDLLLIAEKGNHQQPIPNLFLAAVHYLLFKYPIFDLIKFYPSQGGIFSESEDFFQSFKKFAIQNESEILKILETKSVQTNEVRRCGPLISALSLIAEANDNSQITLIDVGTSSGLNLLMDKYKYIFNGLVFGNSESELTISCSIRGSMTPQISIPKIIRRYGIDINPIALTQPEELLWSKALIWPDQVERIDRLEKAMKIRLQHNVELLKTFENEALIKVLSSHNDSSLLCIMHSFTLNQFSENQRHDFVETIKKHSSQRTIWKVSLEWIGTESPELKIQKFSNGDLQSDISVAYCHGHGEWIEFKTLQLN